MQLLLFFSFQNIDFYLELIKERSARPGYPSVYIFHSFFYTLLTDKDGGYSVVEEATGEVKRSGLLVNIIGKRIVHTNRDVIFQIHLNCRMTFSNMT